MQVLMVGPSLQVLGGVSRVMKQMLNHAPEAIEYTLLPTLSPEAAIYHLYHRRWRYVVSIGRGLYYTAKSLAAAAKRIRSESVDLAHTHFASYGGTFREYFVSRLLYKRGIPYLLHAHGGSYREFYYSMPSFVQRRICWMLRSAKGLIVLSHQWREFYRSLLGDCERPIWVMPNSVELPSEWHVSEEDTLRLLFLGMMGEHKGTDRAMRAVALVPKPLRERVRLYMAGDGDVDAMRRLAAELGLQAQVDIRNWIEGEEKQRWLRETNAFILPSRAEGLPMAMLEAMAYGKALIVSPVGGIPEFVTDGQEGILVPPDDIEAISQAIVNLAENPARRAEMGRAARLRVEPLDVKKYMNQMYEIYRTVLGTQ